MAQVKIYGHKATLERNKIAISEIIHNAITQIFRIPKDKRFHRFFYLEDENFIYPSPRTDNYLIIEIHIMSGRLTTTKKDLIKRLFADFQTQLNISSVDVEIVILESPPENWGFRGLNGDDANLVYPINI
ncbi:tautomerase family protein [Thorsellia anophelis]|uniref:Phenylpyruvate tautomerase PptA, 4-oxalocrotonate tautomerase family n=1 Tax=Thorsellia anophelis DSM 18579 TaxID=1123402 RepID=A0A1I0BJW1_9GAMM|nr:tautomerase family protein [Thorsellia anophelis]SET07241.1 Phenylpyruvate tautomerase PptA, 4-oxalocrotonate tautomerase family [Thorsellia anophelis DSM 18579]